MDERQRGRLAAGTAALCVAVLVAGLATTADRLATSSGSASGADKASHTGAATTTAPATTPALTPTPGTVLAADQVHVIGTVATLHATGAGGAIPLPVTVTVPNRGQGDMTIDKVTVDGRAVTVVWNAGQPLPLSGTGALDLGSANVDASAAGITWHLDLAPRGLAPGHYFAGASVAVGSGGLAEPRDNVSFDAGPGAGFITDGDAQIHLPAQALDLVGPGSVRLTGTLTVIRGASRPAPAVTANFAGGAFQLHLQPASANTYTVDALFQGPVQTA
jgi:hypothetical protein